MRQINTSAILAITVPRATPVTPSFGSPNRPKIKVALQNTIAAGSEYLKVISFSFMFMGFSQVFMSALRSVGKIMLPSVTYIVSLCVNVFCNATFIFGLF